MFFGYSLVGVVEVFATQRASIAELWPHCHAIACGCEHGRVEAAAGDVSGRVRLFVIARRCLPLPPSPCNKDVHLWLDSLALALVSVGFFVDSFRLGMSAIFFMFLVLHFSIGPSGVCVVCRSLAAEQYQCE